MGPSQRALELDSEMCVPILHLPSYQVGKLFKSPVAASIIVSLFVKSVHNKYLAGLLPGFCVAMYMNVPYTSVCICQPVFYPPSIICHIYWMITLCHFAKYIIFISYILKGGRVLLIVKNYTAAAAKSLQSCPTLCDPIDGSPPGSPVLGILQERTLEWVAISFSNAWKWKGKVKSLGCVRLFATPWTAAYQAPPSVGFSRQECWSGT